MIEIDEQKLLEEIEEFKKEKERIKTIVGEIGGIKENHQHVIVNRILIGTIAVILIVGVALSKIDLITTLLISILIGIFKLAWMLYEAQRVTHFQFWILNSLEFRINDMHKKIKKIEKELKGHNEEESN